MNDVVWCHQLLWIVSYNPFKSNPKLCLTQSANTTRVDQTGKYFYRPLTNSAVIVDSLGSAFISCDVCCLYFSFSIRSFKEIFNPDKAQGRWGHIKPSSPFPPNHSPYSPRSLVANQGIREVQEDVTLQKVQIEMYNVEQKWLSVRCNRESIVSVLFLSATFRAFLVPLYTRVCVCLAMLDEEEVVWWARSPWKRRLVKLSRTLINEQGLSLKGHFTQKLGLFFLH